MTHGTLRSLSGFLAVMLGAAKVAAAPSPEQDRHEAAAHEDAGPRPTESLLYLDGGVGYGHVALDTFVAEQTGQRFSAGLIPTSAGGPAADLGVGVRFLFLTAGLRGQLLALQDRDAARNVGGMQLWNLDAALGLRLPFGRVEGHVDLAAGYSRFGGLGDALQGAQRGLDVDGANAELGLGLDYFVSQHFSVGARGAIGALFLSRRSVPLRELAQMQQVGTLSEAEARVLQADGTTAGTAWQLLVGPGLHF